MGNRVRTVVMLGLLTAVGCQAQRQTGVGNPGSPDSWADGFSLDDQRTGLDPDAYKTAESMVVRRDNLHQVLDQGIGRFLGRLEVEPKLSAKRQFVGWQIVRLRQMRTSLRPGDVVVAVNQQRIERPAQVAQLWTNLRKARVIQIDALRDGAPFTVSYDVVD